MFWTGLQIANDSLSSPDVPWAYQDSDTIVDWIFNDDGEDPYDSVWKMVEQVSNTILGQESASSLGDEDQNRLFEVKLEDINGLSYSYTHHFTATAADYNETVAEYELLESDEGDEEGCSGEMHLTFRVNYKRDYEIVMPTVLKGASYQASLESAFQDLFGVDSLELCTYNRLDIESQWSTVNTSSIVMFVSLTSLLGLSVVVGLAARVWNKGNWGINSSKAFAPVDNADWSAVIVLGLQC